MSGITIRISEETLREAEVRAQLLHISKNEYIRRAVDQMNQGMGALERQKRLIAAGKKVRAESMIVNSEFAEIEEAPCS